MARRVHFPRAIAITVSAASLLTGVIAYGPTANAKSVKVQIASARQQLKALNAQAEIASERYNAARIKLTAASSTAQAAQARLVAAQAKAAKLQRNAAAFGVAAYKGTASDSVLTLVGSTGALVNRVSAMQAIANSQSQTLAGLDAAQRNEEQAQSDATAALAQQRSATAALESDRNQVEAAATQEQAILSHLEARERAIIKAAKARAARLAAERAAAKLKAQREAAARAARQLASQPVSPPPTTTSSPSPTHHHSTPTPTPVVTGSGGAATAVRWAYREIGKPYVWAASGPNSFDCSGLTMYVWAKAGVQLEHYTGDQWNEGTHIAQADVQPGDLVFFATNTSDPSTIHHVGIYVGGGMMIDAPYTGVDVRKEPAFRSDYIGAVRPG